MRKFILFAAFLLAIPACNSNVPTPIPIPTPGPGGWVPPNPGDPSVTKLIAAVNQQRASHKLPALKAEPHLMQAAQIQAGNMARLNQMSHTLNVPGERTVEDRVAKAGYTNWREVGENIAWNYTTDNVVTGWMNSPGHRVNILGNYTETGFAIAKNSKGEPYYAQTFGRR